MAAPLIAGIRLPVSAPMPASLPLLGQVSVSVEATRVSIGAGVVGAGVTGCGATGVGMNGRCGGYLQRPPRLGRYR